MSLAPPLGTDKEPKASRRSGGTTSPLIASVPPAAGRKASLWSLPIIIAQLTTMQLAPQNSPLWPARSSAGLVQAAHGQALCSSAFGDWMVVMKLSPWGYSLEVPFPCWVLTRAAPAPTATCVTCRGAPSTFKASKENFSQYPSCLESLSPGRNSHLFLRTHLVRSPW